jgi:AsmA protein
VIRANKVSARLRLSSLWRRHVEFSTISFEVDEHGSGPSVNLVRRADGRWNFESILLHAAQTETAPTGQREAGPEPRFPYIQATGARLNVKMGDEKMPLALTEAEFALWLPSPQQWRLRLAARPARTDTSVSDTGDLTVEATLQRAARLEDVPIEMTAAWRRAPLGETSRVLTGNDAGWRGSVDAAVTLHGTLGDAPMTGTLKLRGVRRADFIPGKTLDVDVECMGHLAVNTAVIHQPACTTSLPGQKDGGGLVAGTADLLDLTGLHTSGLRLGMTNVPDAWLLDWARLFSRRIPANFEPQGKVAGTMARVAGQAGGGSWQGQFRDTAVFEDYTVPLKHPPELREFLVASSGEGFALMPVNVAPVGRPPLMLSGSIGKQSYSVRLAGTASPQEVGTLVAALPPLGDGLDHALPGSGSAAVKVDVVCTRAWGGVQSCAAVRAQELVKKPQRRRRR